MCLVIRGLGYARRGPRLETIDTHFGLIGKLSDRKLIRARYIRLGASHKYVLRSARRYIFLAVCFFQKGFTFLFLI